MAGNGKGEKQNKREEEPVAMVRPGVEGPEEEALRAEGPREKALGVTGPGEEVLGARRPGEEVLRIGRLGKKASESLVAIAATATTYF